MNSNYSAPDPKKLERLMPSRDSGGRLYTPYEKCVRRIYLTNLFHPVKLGLDNIEALHSSLGNPMDHPDVTIIHVAGTNGKGSTSLKIARTLEKAGHKVGLFVSPHVASFRERMQVNGDLITEKEVEEYLPMIFGICEKKHIPATCFEVTTALAFHFFAKRNVDVVVLETGMGGRLDATNVIQKPALSVITSIGLEHTKILGDTVELIAVEKAGIIKKDAPVLVGPHCPHETIRQCALDIGASKYYTCGDVLGDDSVQEYNCIGDKSSGFFDYDLENSMIARCALKILEINPTSSTLNLPLAESMTEEALGQRPPCRFEEMNIQGPSGGVRSVKVILDVAHNPDAMVFLVEKLKMSYPDLVAKMRIIVGFSSDKDLQSCGGTLLDFLTDASHLHLVEASHPRAAKLQNIIAAEPALKESHFDVDDRSVTAQIKSAIPLAEKNGEILIVCGSVFLMAEAREALGIDEPRDSQYIAEVAGANFRHRQEFFADEDPEHKKK